MNLELEPTKPVTKREYDGEVGVVRGLGGGISDRYYGKEVIGLYPQFPLLPP